MLHIFLMTSYIFPAPHLPEAPRLPAGALVLQQDVLYEVIAASGGAGPDSGGGAFVQAKDQGQPVEARSRADIETLPGLCDILCEGPRSFPLWLMGCLCSGCCMAPHTNMSMGTIGRHQCAYLAVRVSGQRQPVALSRRAWRPGAVESLFKYRDALNDHLAARGE